MMVESLIEHDDGTATMMVNMSAEETRQLIESAVRIGLIEGLKMAEDKRMKEWQDERSK